MNSPVRKSPANWLPWIVGGALLAAAFFLRGPAVEWLRKALNWIDNAGAWGPVAFIGLYILACVFSLPGSLLTLGAGAVFGLVYGAIWVSIASTLGATASFLIGRFLARDWVASKLQSRPVFKSIDESVGREGWKIVGLLRLSPVFPFSLLNYGLGVTQVSLRDYILASWIGMMPGTILYVYTGSLLGRAFLSGTTGATQRNPAQWFALGIGLVATLVATVLITRMARKALDRKLTPLPSP